MKFCWGLIRFAEFGGQGSFVVIVRIIKHMALAQSWILRSIRSVFKMLCWVQNKIRHIKALFSEIIMQTMMLSNRRELDLVVYELNTFKRHAFNQWGQLICISAQPSSQPSSTTVVQGGSDATRLRLTGPWSNVFFWDCKRRKRHVAETGRMHCW